jgi:lipopolysaccharide biosynthesis glycosyltransferase
LNLIFGSDYLTMSFRWNFPIFFLSYGFQNLIRPQIYHFMSNPRPWNGPFEPWGVEFCAPYVELVRKYPDVARFLGKFGLLRTLRYEAQYQMKLLLEGSIWRSQEMRERVLRVEQDAAF